MTTYEKLVQKIHEVCPETLKRYFPETKMMGFGDLPIQLHHVLKVMQVLGKGMMTPFVRGQAESTGNSGAMPLKR